MTRTKKILFGVGHRRELSDQGLEQLKDHKKDSVGANRKTDDTVEDTKSQEEIIESLPDQKKISGSREVEAGAYQENSTQSPSKPSIGNADGISGGMMPMLPTPTIPAQTTPSTTAAPKAENKQNCYPKRGQYWWNKFNELKAYKAEHGTTTVSCRKNYDLYHWEKRQREQMAFAREGNPSSLTEKQIQLLEEIGVAATDEAPVKWNILSEQQKKDLEEVLYAKKQPSKKRRKMTRSPEITKRSTREKKWYKKLEELKKYKDEYGTTWVSSTHSNHLYHWLKRQRDALGLTTKNLLGNTSAPKHCLMSKDGKEGEGMGEESCDDTEVEESRSHAGSKRKRAEVLNLKDSRYDEVLKTINADAPTALWTVHMAELRSFHAKEGHCFVPSESFFGYWVEHIRSLYFNTKMRKKPCLSKNQMFELDKICFTKRKGSTKQLCAAELASQATDPTERASHREQNWYRKLEELKAYKEIHGTLLVDYTHNRSLYDWLVRQNNLIKLKRGGHHSSIDENMIQELEKVGLVCVEEEKVMDIYQDKTNKDASEYKNEDISDPENKIASASNVSNNTADALESWALFLDELTKYKEEKGNVDVHYPSLGNWVQQHFTFKQLQDLISHDFATGSGLPSLASWKIEWYRNFERLRRYKVEHGTCAIKNSGEDLELYNWVHAQKKEMNYLKQGMWSCLKEGWIKMLEELGFDFFKDNITCLSSKQISDIEEVLSEVTPIKSSPGKERTIARESVEEGQPVSREDVIWHQKLEDLKRYKLINGHCDVSAEENRELHYWVIGQKERLQKSKCSKSSYSLPSYELKPGKKDKSKMSIRVKAWYDNLEKLQQYKTMHGTTDVVRSHDTSLYNWVRKQKEKLKLAKGGSNVLKQDWIHELNQLGMNGDSDSAFWTTCFKDLQTIKEETGRCYVPKDYTANPILEKWVEVQIIKYKLAKQKKPSGLTRSQVMLLDKIDFPTRKSQKQRKSSSKDEKVVHPNQNDADRVQFLPGTVKGGMSKWEKNWTQKLKTLKEHFREHGTYHVTSKQNGKLYKWIIRQKEQMELIRIGERSTLKDYQVAELRKIGF